MVISLAGELAGFAPEDAPGAEDVFDHQGGGDIEPLPLGVELGETEWEDLVNGSRIERDFDLDPALDMGMASGVGMTRVLSLADEFGLEFEVVESGHVEDRPLDRGPNNNPHPDHGGAPERMLAVLVTPTRRRGSPVRDSHGRQLPAGGDSEEVDESGGSPVLHSINGTPRGNRDLTGMPPEGGHVSPFPSPRRTTGTPIHKRSSKTTLKASLEPLSYGPAPGNADAELHRTLVDDIAVINRFITSVRDTDTPISPAQLTRTSQAVRETGVVPRTASQNPEAIIERYLSSLDDAEQIRDAQITELSTILRGSEINWMSRDGDVLDLLASWESPPSSPDPEATRPNASIDTIGEGRQAPITRPIGLSIPQDWLKGDTNADKVLASDETLDLDEHHSQRPIRSRHSIATANTSFPVAVQPSVPLISISSSSSSSNPLSAFAPPKSPTNPASPLPSLNNPTPISKAITTLLTSTSHLLTTLSVLSESLHHQTSFHTSTTRQIRGLRATISSWREREELEESARRGIEAWEKAVVERGLRGEGGVGIGCGAAARREMEGFRGVMEAVERRWRRVGAGLDGGIA